MSPKRKLVDTLHAYYITNNENILGDVEFNVLAKDDDTKVILAFYWSDRFLFKGTLLLKQVRSLCLLLHDINRRGKISLLWSSPSSRKLTFQIIMTHFKTLFLSSCLHSYILNKCFDRSMKVKLSALLGNYDPATDRTDRVIGKFRCQQVPKN